MAKRIYMTFAPGEWRGVKELLKRRHPYLAEATSAKLILMELAENKGPVEQSAPSSTSKVLAAPDSTSQHLEAPCHTPSPARDADQSGTDLALFREEKRREEKTEEKNKNRKGSVRGNLLFGQVAKAVISAMNQIAGRDWTPKAWEPQIGKLLAKGHTQDDLMTVVDWKAAEAKRTGDWQWFKPDTLFRPTLFAGKLDNAKAGVKMNGNQRSMFGPTPQSRQQDYSKQTPEGDRNDF